MDKNRFTEDLNKRRNFKPLEEVKKEYEKEKRIKEDKEAEEKEYIASQPF